MLYRFKSKAAGDVVMLEPNGRRILEILGKDPSRPGIILPEEIPAAIEALRVAVAAEEANDERQHREAEGTEEEPLHPVEQHVPLRTRVAPFIEMLHYCQREGCEVVWGV